MAIVLARKTEKIWWSIGAKLQPLLLNLNPCPKSTEIEVEIDELAYAPLIGSINQRAISFSSIEIFKPQLLLLFVCF